MVIKKKYVKFPEHFIPLYTLCRIYFLKCNPQTPSNGSLVKTFTPNILHQTEKIPAFSFLLVALLCLDIINDLIRFDAVEIAFC